jgi:hypothetical protein
MLSSIGKVVLAGLVSCALGGCFQLDSFLYTRERLTHYVFEPQGDSESTTITAEQIEPVTLHTEDELTLGAVYVRAREQPARAYVLFFHGNGPALPRQFTGIKRLSNLGYDVLGFDYRGWGISSDVIPTEEGLGKDSRAALAWLSRRAGSTERIIYYGHSFGGAVATQLAEQQPPRALILESTFSSVADLKTDSSQMDLPVGYVADDTWDTAARLGRIHAPLLLLHGLDDDFLRPEFSEKLYEVAHEPKQLVRVEGAAHDTVARTMGEDFAITVNGFVEQHLPSAPGPGLLKRK